jgi:hypothetical protein
MFESVPKQSSCVYENQDLYKVQSLLPLSGEPLKKKRIGLFSKAAASCRTPKAPSGRSVVA